MKIVMYGTGICPDCVEAKEQLKNNSSFKLDYRDITATTSTLKEFLSYRDHDAIFASVIEEGRIGIPFFILEDGTKTFEISDFVDLADLKGSGKEQTVNSCSIDGKGHC
jgi:glutaredoxin-related protein